MTKDRTMATSSTYMYFFMLASMKRRISETVILANVLSVLRFAVSDYLFKLFSLIKEQTI
jgi:hypothetical protein